MRDYKEILKSAVKSYSEVSKETKELYKRYTLSPQIPIGKDGKDEDSGFDELKNEIAKESKLKFDLTNGKNGLSSNSEFIKVVKKKAKKRNEEKEYATFEEKLGNFITEKSESTLVVDIPDNKEAKLNFLFVCGNRNLPMETVINVGKNAKLSLFEWYGSVASGKAIVATMRTVSVGEGSDVEINTLHNENHNTLVGSLSKAVTHDSSNLKLNTVYNGGSVTKATCIAEASGRWSEVNVNEIIFGHGEQKFDINTFVLNSNEMTKAVLKSGSVLKGESFCMLKGYAKVAKDTNGAFSKVEEKGLILDKDSKVQMLPDMSINCRDVASASHSASASPIDSEKLFYLMSRGINKEKAKRIFVASFISDHLAGMESDIVKEIAISVMLDKFDTDRLSSVPKISMRDFWVVPKHQAKKHEV